MIRYSLLINSFLFLNCNISYSQDYQVSNKFRELIHNELIQKDEFSIDFDDLLEVDIHCNSGLISNMNLVECMKALLKIHNDYIANEEIVKDQIIINEAIQIASIFNVNWLKVWWYLIKAVSYHTINKNIEAKVLIDSAAVLYDLYELKSTDSTGLYKGICQAKIAVNNTLGLEMPISEYFDVMDSFSLMINHGDYEQIIQKTYEIENNSEDDHDIAICIRYFAKYKLGQNVDKEYNYIEKFINDTTSYHQINEQIIPNYIDDRNINKRKLKYGWVMNTLILHNEVHPDYSKLHVIRNLLDEWYQDNKLFKVDYNRYLNNFNELYSNFNPIKMQIEKFINSDFDSALYYNNLIDRSSNYKFNSTINVEEKCESLNNYSIILANKNNFSKALAVKKSEILLRSKYDKQNESLIKGWIHLADLYISNCQFDFADSLFKKILINKNILDLKSIEYLYKELIRFYYVQEQFDSVLMINKEYDKLNLAVIDPKAIISIKLSSLISYCMLKKTKNALKEFKNLDSGLFTSNYLNFNQVDISLFYLTGYYIYKTLGDSNNAAIYKLLLNNYKKEIASAPFECILFYKLLNDDKTIFDERLLNYLILFISNQDSENKEFIMRINYKEVLLNFYLNSKQYFLITKENTILDYLIQCKYREFDILRNIQLAKKLFTRINSTNEITFWDNDVINLQNISNLKFKKKLADNLYRDELLWVISKFNNEYFAFIFDSKLDTVPIIKIGSINEENVRMKYYKYMEYNDIESGNDLYELLIEKMLNYNYGNKRIFLVPDGIYREVNINALPITLSHKYILDSMGYITYLSTFNSLLPNELLELSSEVYVFANPNYGNINDQNNFKAFDYIKSRTGKLFNFPQLPGTEGEIEPIKKYFDSTELKIYKNEEAIEANFLKLIGPRVIHIATHGFIKSKNNNNEGGFVLAFSNEQNRDIHNDGYIFTSDILKMDFANTNLVVLSMCDSGLNNGDTFSSLSDSFLKSGASNVMYSTTKVDDKATAKFMDKFYSYYSVSSNPSKAIQSAMQEMRILYSNPRDWGSFMLMQSFK